MKSERRHELQHNELADWLVKWAETIKPYQNLILGGVLLVLIAVAGFGWWSRQSRREAAEAWTVFNQAMSMRRPAAFVEVVERYPGTRAADAAALMAGDLYLHEGANLQFVNKAGANLELRKAVEYYQRVLDQSREPTLRERATFGLARAFETQATDLDKAVEYYEEVARWPHGAFVEEARRRADDLKRPATKAMYDRFAKFDPRPAPGDVPGAPGRRPEFDFDSLPEGPVFTPALPYTPTPAPDGPVTPPGEPGAPDAAETLPGAVPFDLLMQPPGETTAPQSPDQPPAQPEP